MQISCVPMFNPSALHEASSKLKAVAIQHDASAPKIALGQDRQSEEQRNKYQTSVLDANLESYYTLLGPDLTFRTEFVPLTIDDARFFVKHYEAREQFRSRLIIDGASEHDVDARSAEWITGAFQERISSLESRLAPVMASMMGAGSPGCFVKFSSRSPKDAAILKREKVSRIFRDELQKLPDDSVNSRIIALLSSGGKMLCCATPTDAIALLRVSERIYQDCLLALDQPDRFLMHMCVREWKSISPRDEFRCFCPFPHGRMAAMSQYNMLAFWPELLEQREHVSQRVQEFFTAAILPKLRATNLCESGFVCDIAIDSDTGRLWCMELNPFQDTTDGALFSWVRERAVLEGRDPVTGALLEGSAPVVRFVEKSPIGAKALIAASWRWLLELPMDA